MSTKWLLPFLLIVAIVPFAIYFSSNGLNSSLFNSRRSAPPVATIQFQQPNIRRVMEPGAQFGITAMQIKDGYKFKLGLDNGEWIEAHLPHATIPEATPVVVNMFQTGAQPSVVLYRKVDDYWIADINLFLPQTGRVSVVLLLQQQGLTY